jgi:threonine dehydrogenase-like Zn-dependent dehydrogenase
MRWLRAADQSVQGARGTARIHAHIPGYEAQRGDVDMRALVVDPREVGQARLQEVPEPDRGDRLLVEAVAVGVCGTDREIVRGEHGTAPPGLDYLILGHESLGRVVESGGGFSEGDLVAGIVRRPDPVPCGACARGDWDMCRNGRYTERGIKGLPGYASERWTIEPEYAVHIPAQLGLAGVLTEPASVVAKAWEQIERIGARSWWEPKRVLVAGAGPIGMLAALLGVQRGMETHVLDRVADGPKPAAVAALGATYHSGAAADVAKAVNADIVLECTGVGSVLMDVMENNAANGIVCLTGVSHSARTLDVNAEQLNRRLVLDNDVVFGSVNASRRHYEAAVQALLAADPEWLARLITRRVPLAGFAEALAAQPDDIKVVLTFSGMF